MSPGEVRLLIHLYADPSPLENGGGYQDTLNKWLREGIIEANENDRSGYRTTPRGSAWVQLICATPMPVSVWIDPRETE